MKLNKLASRIANLKKIETSLVGKTGTLVEINDSIADALHGAFVSTSFDSFTKSLPGGGTSFTKATGSQQ
jgi:hypothetical protein